MTARSADGRQVSGQRPGSAPRSSGLATTAAAEPSRPGAPAHPANPGASAPRCLPAGASCPFGWRAEPADGLVFLGGGRPQAGVAGEGSAGSWFRG